MLIWRANLDNLFAILSSRELAPGAQAVLAPPKSAFTFKCSVPSSVTVMRKRATIDNQNDDASSTVYKHSLKVTGGVVNAEDAIVAAPNAGLTCGLTQSISGSLPASNAPLLIDVSVSEQKESTAKLPSVTQPYLPASMASMLPVDLSKCWPERTHESPAPATKTRTSRFFPATAIQSDNIFKTTTACSTLTDISKEDACKKHRPPPLKLDTSLIRKDEDDIFEPMIKNTPYIQDTRRDLGGRKKFGSDMSHLRIRTGGFDDPNKREHIPEMLNSLDPRIEAHGKVDERCSNMSGGTEVGSDWEGREEAFWL